MLQAAEFYFIFSFSHLEIYIIYVCVCACVCVIKKEINRIMGMNHPALFVCLVIHNKNVIWQQKNHM